jgi:hypothetical protein
MGKVKRNAINADEIEVYAPCTNCPPTAKVERNGANITESERRVTEFLTDCSPPVRAR